LGKCIVKAKRNPTFGFQVYLSESLAYNPNSQLGQVDSGEYGDRRGEFPGVVELTMAMTPPSFLEDSNVCKLELDHAQAYE
jgi:hypothetical protein